MTAKGRSSATGEEPLPHPGPEPDGSGPRAGVPPTPVGTQRRIRALMNRAWSPPAIEAVTGIPAGDVLRALRDRRNVSRELAQQVADAYEGLWNRQPPRRTDSERESADAAERIARQRCWPPPAGWDDDELDREDARPRP